MKRVLIFFFATFFLFNESTGFATTLKTSADSLNNPTIAGKLQKNTVKIGGLTISTPEFYVLKSENKNIGAFAPDEGEFTLTINNQYCIPVCERNAERWHLDKKIKGGTLVIRKRFKKAYFLTTDFNYDYSQQKNTIAFPDSFKEFIKNNELVNPAMDILGAKLESNELAVAVFETVTGFFYYIFDPDRTESEKLFFLRKSKYTALYEKFEVAYQPYGRKVFDIPAPQLTVSRIDIDFKNENKDNATYRVLMEIKLNSDLNGLSLKLIDHFYTFNKNTREVESRRALQVQSLKINGQNADFVHKANRLVVDFGKTIKKGATITCETELKGDILYHPNGDNFWKLGNIAWYPQANLNEERATIHIKAKVYGGYSVFASGNTISLKRKNDSTAIETELNFPVQRPVITAGKYFIHKKNLKNRSCIVATHGTKKKKASKKVLNYFFAASDIMEKAFNKPYPFEQQYIIETNFRAYEEGPSIIFTGKDIFDPKKESDELTNLKFLKKISKAYFRHMINIPDENELWISESFSEYTAALTYMSLFRKRKVAEKKFMKILRLWKRGAELVKSGSSIYLANHLSLRKKKDFYDKLHLLYDKGPYVLHVLRIKMQDKYGKQNGDRMFFIWINSILKSFKGRYVNTYDCIRLLNMITKDDWTPFFERYIFGDETPELNI